MRKPLVAGNWKMNKRYSAAKELLEAVTKEGHRWPDRVDVMIAPPAPYLADFALHATERVAVGAQDVSARSENGAYTGEYSAAMLRSSGVRYAIIGHSERRAYHHETDEVANDKIRACSLAGLIPVYCCGEKLEDRETGNHVEVVSAQIRTALKGFSTDEVKDLVVAYEPVWAIGTGKTASPQQAQEMHAHIRSVIKEIFDDSLSESVRILYGGSCKPDNAKEIFSGKDVDGGLIGGASLNAEDFGAIIRAAAG